MAKSNRPKSRQSIAHIPSKSSLDRDNATADIATIQRDQSRSNRSSKKKLRGKSLGPGGLEALQESSGNTIKVKLLIANFVAPADEYSYLQVFR